MSQDKKKESEAGEPKREGKDPDDLSVVDYADYQVVKPEYFRRRGKKKDKEAT